MGKKIAIIGGGNLGSAIAEGLLKSKFSKPSEIIVTKRNPATLKDLKSRGVGVSDNNNDAVRNSEVVILVFGMKNHTGHPAFVIFIGTIDIEEFQSIPTWAMIALVENPFIELIF